MNSKESRGRSHATYGWWLVAVLTLGNILNFVDRQLPIILIESIKRDLHLTDTQIGLLAGFTFTFAYSISGLALAALADRFSRKWVLVGSVTLWSLFTAAGGLAQNFTHFAFARLGVAVGESGCQPPSHALISEHFPPERRALPLAVFASGAAVGFMGGLMLGGFINDIANWRTALFVVVAPGMLLALAMAIGVREGWSAPGKVRAERSGGASLAEVARHFLRTPALRLLILGAICYGFGTGGVTTFLAAFFIRSHHLSTTQIGLMLGLGMGLGAGVGTVIGGFVSDRAGRRDARLRLWAPAAVTALMVPLVLGALLVTSSTLAFVCLGLSFVCSSFFLAPLVSGVQSLVPTRMRSVASAIAVIAGQGIGSSVGALAIGMMSDHLHPIFGQESLRYALMIGVLSMWGGAIFYLLGGRAMPADLLKLEQAERAS